MKFILYYNLLIIDRLSIDLPQIANYIYGCSPSIELFKYLSYKCQANDENIQLQLFNVFFYLKKSHKLLVWFLYVIDL